MHAADRNPAFSYKVYGDEQGKKTASAFSYKVYGGEQGNKTAQQLEKDDKEGKVPKEFFNNYTIVSYSDGKYSQVAYADYFKDEVAEIVGLFNSWIAGMPSTCQFCHYEGSSALYGPMQDHPGSTMMPVVLICIRVW